jgi:hypothetical protein
VVISFAAARGVVLKKSAHAPLAVLKSPSVLLERANAPVAVFSSAMVFFASASVFLPYRHVAAAGIVADQTLRYFTGESV